MRINVYSQELLTDPRGGCALTGSPHYHDIVEREDKRSNTGAIYSAVRLFLHSSERLHHPPADDDRSAITFWLPKSNERREAFAVSLEALARLVREAPAETGID